MCWRKAVCPPFFSARGAGGRETRHYILAVETVYKQMIAADCTDAPTGQVFLVCETLKAVRGKTVHGLIEQG